MTALVENLEAHIRLNARGEMSAQLTLDYIKLEVKEYNRRQLRRSGTTTKYKRGKCSNESTT